MAGFKGTQNISRDRADPISIAKIKKGGETFEIVLRDPDLALEFRLGKDANLRDILETPKIFSDAKRGEHASPANMEKWLGTSDEKEVAKIILKKGELSLTQEQRKRMFDAKKSKIIDYIQTNASDPKTKLPHPRIRIENAMAQAKVQIDAYKSAEEQLDKIIESLRVILPISLEKAKLKVIIPAKYSGSAYSALKGKYKFTSEKWNNDGSVEIKVEIPAGLKTDFFNLANGLTAGDVIIEDEK
ncbi:MAG: ribosome assembly factor SBDS [DPANN group archaeon]|nr:ribosome assembly factor SBDS [DPANN group archaeon]